MRELVYYQNMVTLPSGKLLNLEHIAYVGPLWGKSDVWCYVLSCGLTMHLSKEDFDWLSAIASKTV